MPVQKIGLLLYPGCMPAGLFAFADLLPLDIVTRTKQPYRAPDSASFFVDGKAPDFVDDLLSAERLRTAGYFEPTMVGRLVDKCRAGKATGFADNQAFVGILSTMLLHDGFIRDRMSRTTTLPATGTE